MLHNASFRTSNFVVVFWRDRKNRLLKTYSYDCSALKYYTTLQFSGDELYLYSNYYLYSNCNCNIF